MDDPLPAKPSKDRGALSNPTGRFEPYTRHAFDDGWPGAEEDQLPPPATTVTDEVARSAISRNRSPDVGFDRSINPYRGCEHGCVYCFARPTHAYSGLSPGLDFETRLFAKSNAPEVLARELGAPGYTPRPILLGANTDPYQPVERHRRITRGILEVLATFHHPVAIATKSGLIVRDLDILAPMAAKRLACVAVSLTTLDPWLARTMEPRAASPRRRLATMRALSAADVPLTVLAAPMIPHVNDHELERILSAASAAGAIAAGYVLIRLPLELRELFSAWLRTHLPDRAERVLSRLRDCSAGNLYVSDFGTRMRGTGAYADLLAQRFTLACKRLGLNASGSPATRLDSGQFRRPPRANEQLSLF